MTTSLFAACALMAAGWAFAEPAANVGGAGPAIPPSTPAAARPNAAAPAPDPDESVFSKKAPVIPDKPAPIPGLTDKFGDDTRKPGQLLGEPFENQVAGLVFNPPAGSKRQSTADPDHNPDHVVDYADNDRQWLLQVTRARLAQPMPLQTIKGPKQADRVGLLDYKVNDIVRLNPAAEVLRQDIVNVGEYGVGLAVLRYNVGNQRYLRQQAIFQVSEQLYYIFNFTTPAAKEGKPEDNPAERLAVETFTAMLDTIRVLDRSWIAIDQKNRLYRTRRLFVDWGEKGGQMIKNAVIPKQWFRIVRNGKDVGYTYRFEQVTEAKDSVGNPSRAFDGVLIGLRSRSLVDGTLIDSGTQMFSALDRKHEDWATVTNITSKKGTPDEEKRQRSEYGNSETKVTRKVEDDPLKPGGKVLRSYDTYLLSVSRPKRETPWAAGTDAGKPEYHNPSVFYIPQAVGSMLPRLLPLHRSVTYLFQTYVGDEREVILRYVDVGFEKEVQLEGRTFRAVPITDRIRLEGVPTITYMSPDGRFLGSVTENDGVKVTILPATKEELEKIWPNEKIWPVSDEDPAGTKNPAAAGAVPSRTGTPAGTGTPVRTSAPDVPGLPTELGTPAPRRAQ